MNILGGAHGTQNDRRTNLSGTGPISRLGHRKRRSLLVFLAVRAKEGHSGRWVLNPFSPSIEATPRLDKEQLL